MSELHPTARTGAGSPAGATAGALLGAAREASGLSIDAVAQQLKLAPRQVRAIEAGDFSHLPGRTFVRGFIRNYARLVMLDPEQVLGALPARGATPALDAPTLQPTAPAMGELPSTAQPPKAGWMRWAIPVTLAAVVAAAAIYEWKRSAGSTRQPVATDAGNTAGVPAAAAPIPDKTETPLPNPFAGATPLAQPASSEAAAAAGAPKAVGVPPTIDGKGAARAP